MKNEIKVGGVLTLEFIGTYDDLVENVITFNNCINDSDLLKSRLRQFKHWYYIEELDKFAPSKFIGYKGNSSEAYERGTDPGNSNPGTPAEVGGLKARKMPKKSSELPLLSLATGLEDGSLVFYGLVF